MSKPSLAKCLTFAIWQYDLRNEPLRDDMLERQAHEVLEAEADGLLRGWFKWGDDLDYAAMESVPQALEHAGGLFCGGLTCCVAKRGENGLSEDDLVDMTTRAATWDPQNTSDNGLLPFEHEPIFLYWSIHNPRTAEYLAECAARQIAAGAHALHLDEIWAMGTTVSVLKNAGYDDYAITKFREYLRGKYAAYSAEDWRGQFGIEDIDTFDYRRYLQEHGWAENPDAHYGENPLAAEWKTPVVLEPTVCETWFEPDPDRSFYEWGVLDFTRRLSEAIRDRASAMGREVALVHNGPWPGMDFQNWNVPLQAPGTDYASFRCHRKRWEKFRALTDRWSGSDAPAVAFLDWPGDLPVFGKCRPEERETFFRTVPAECYGAGCSFAFHLRNLFCDAQDLGQMPLIQELCRWFAQHRALFRPLGVAIEVETDPDDLCVSAWRREHDVVLHLVNHRENNGVIEPMGSGRVRLPEGLGLSGEMALHSPDPEEAQPRLHLEGREVRIEHLHAHAVVCLPVGRERV